MPSSEPVFTENYTAENCTPWKLAKLDGDEYDYLVDISVAAGIDTVKLPEYVQKLYSEFNNKADSLTSLDMMKGMFEVREMPNGTTTLEVIPGMYEKIRENKDNTDFTVRTRKDMVTLLKMADKLTEIKEIGWAVISKDYDTIRRLVG